MNQEHKDGALDKLVAAYERMLERPSIQASWPPHWRESTGADAGYDQVE